MENKKADVPVMILVLGVFALVGMALLSFYVAGLKTGEIKGVESVEQANSLVDDFYFYENVGYSRDKIIQIMNLTESSEGILFLVENDGVSVSYVLRD